MAFGGVGLFLLAVLLDRVSSVEAPERVKEVLVAVGYVMFAFGIGWHVYARVMAWWHHG